MPLTEYILFSMQIILAFVLLCIVLFIATLIAWFFIALVIYIKNAMKGKTK